MHRVYDAPCLVAHAEPEHERGDTLRKKGKVLATQLRGGNMGDALLAQQRCDTVDGSLGEGPVVHHSRIAADELEGVMGSRRLAHPGDHSFQALWQVFVHL